MKGLVVLVVLFVMSYIAAFIGTAFKTWNYT